MKKTNLIIGMLLAVIFVSPLFANTGLLEISVMLDGKAIAGAQVSLLDKETGITSLIKTSSNGSAWLYPFIDHSFDLTVTYQNYSFTTTRILSSQKSEWAMFATVKFNSKNGKAAFTMVEYGASKYCSLQIKLQNPNPKATYSIDVIRVDLQPNILIVNRGALVNNQYIVYVNKPSKILIKLYKNSTQVMEESIDATGTRKCIEFDLNKSGSTSASGGM